MLKTTNTNRPAPRIVPTYTAGLKFSCWTCRGTGGIKGPCSDCNGTGKAE